MDTEATDNIYSKLCDLEKLLVKLNDTQSEIAKHLASAKFTLGVLSGDHSSKGSGIGLTKIQEMLKKLVSE